MQMLKRSQKLLLAYSSFVVLSILLVLKKIISSSSEPANAVLFGLSALRLAMTMGLFLLLIFFVTMAFKATKDRGWAGRFLQRWFAEDGVSQRIGWLSGIGFGLSWIGFLLPGYRMGKLEDYLLQSQPVIMLVFFVSMATLVLYLVARYKFTVRDLDLKLLGLGLPLFILSLFVLGWMFYTGFGVSSSEDFWYGAGVPILLSQLVIAIIGGLFFLYLEPKLQSNRAELLVCILIYVFAAYFWAHEPLNRSFLFTKPSDPNYEFYPFADAAAFDAASQFPLIGEKINIYKSVFFERPLYLSFLVYLHLFFGQNFETLMAVQAGVFAILPVLIYLIGKSLDTRPVGFSLAIVSIFRGINSISASNMIDMANSKMMLTDFPTAIGIALIVLFLCEWLKKTDWNRHYLIWVGGAIGFTLMLRTNALLLLVLVPVYIFIKLFDVRKQWLIASCLIALGVVAITLPWEIRNLSLGGQMYGSIVGKFQDVIKTRYLPAPQQEGSLPYNPESSLFTLNSTQAVVSLYQDNSVIRGNQPCNTFVCFSMNHFLHNVLTSVLIFPTSPILDDLTYLIRDRNPYYWDAEWDGTFTGTAPFFLILNLFLITTGIVFAWKEKRFRGLTPLTVFIIYNISNGLARTSGGRYIVPVDWIVPLYFLLGVFYLGTWLVGAVGTRWSTFSRTSEQDVATLHTKGRLSKALFSVVILLGIGSLIPISENLRQPRYQNIDPEEILVMNRSLIDAEGLELDELDNFLQSKDARILIGRALYPRYYRMNQGEINFGFYPYVTMAFPRTAFKLIGPEGEYSVVLPGKIHQNLPHASDVFVLGCDNPNYLDALVVIVLGEDETVYTRKPSAELHCPIQQPACSNNSDCK